MKCFHLCLLALSPLHAQPQQDGFDDIEDFIDKIQTQRKQILEGGAKLVLSSLDRAMRSDSSLVKAYVTAYCKTKFGEGEVADSKLEMWKLQNQSMLSSTDFKKALRIHATFLMSALLKNLGKDEKAVEFSKRTYSLAVGADAKPRIGRYAKYDVIKRPLSQSPFIGYGGRENALLGLRGWYTGPVTEIAEMHRSNIMGPMRKAKSKDLFNEWKRNIQLEKTLALEKGQEEQFIEVRDPQLKWQMAADYVKYGQHRKAMDLMKKALDGNHMHPQFQRMIGDLKNWLSDARGDGDDKAQPQAP